MSIIFGSPSVGKKAPRPKVASPEKAGDRFIEDAPYFLTPPDQRNASAMAAAMNPTVASQNIVPIVSSIFVRMPGSAQFSVGGAYSISWRHLETY
jgi:hypothetical protein